MVFILFATHLLACFWCFLGRLDFNIVDDNDKYSWVFENGFDKNDVKTIYITAIYFILETLTTVGYGDYTGNTTNEYIFCMVLEVQIYFFNLILVYWFKFLLFFDG
jgi:hypothetical protein